MTASRKLLVLGFDAASPSLLRRWSADGTMPALRELLARGLVGTSRSVAGLFVGATWPSFYTGLHPGNHGVFWLDRLLPGTYRTQRLRARDLARRPTVWEVLDAAGKEVVVLDVPLTRRSRAMTGTQVVEWGVHDAAFGFQTLPRSLARGLRRDPGPHPAPARCDAPARTLEDYRVLTDQLVRGTRARSALTRRLLASGSWDFAIQVFSETHCAGHQLWHLHDPAHPGFDPRATAALGDPIREIYRAVDTAAGEIIESVGRDVAVVLVDLHGMSWTGGASLLLPEVLRRLDMSRASAPGVTSGGPVDGDRSIVDWARHAYGQLPRSLRAPVYAWRQRCNQWLGRGTPIGIDPARTKVIYVDLGTGSPCSGLRFNLAGREPGGILSAADADRCRAALETELAALVDPETQRPLVARILRTAELYPGPYAGDLPDLVVEWDMETARGSAVVGSGAGAVWRATSPSIGTVAVTNTYCRTGEHRGEGLVVVAGPGIAAGELGRTVSVLDYAPTFARYLGAAMPASDGSAITEMLE